MSTLGEMASGVAHEINQPLSAIQIGSDLISNLARQGRGISLSDLRIVADQMRDQVDRAVRIINHLREFGRKEEIKREKIHINKPIEGVFTLLGQQLKLRGIEVVLELEEGLPPIMADVNRLEQVFVDLVVNARDSMEEKDMEFVEGHIERDPDRQVHEGRRSPGGYNNGHWHRDTRRGERQNLRTVLHDKRGRKGYRFGSVHQLRHHQGL